MLVGSSGELNEKGAIALLYTLENRAVPGPRNHETETQLEPRVSPPEHGEFLPSVRDGRERLETFGSWPWAAEGTAAATLRPPSPAASPCGPEGPGEQRWASPLRRRHFLAPPGPTPRDPGLLPATDGEARGGLICRKTASADLVAGSPARLQGSYCARPSTPPPGPWLGEKPRRWQQKLEPRRRGGREGPRPRRALLPLAKVNQTVSRFGGARRERRQLGPGETWATRAGPGLGEPSRPLPAGTKGSWARRD
ncbi:hypothetical protein GHT09_016598 [Marmota monax]|uniref:Uncharacterized protein n=1 Tax=Marmota monax TaxID=9995 RepID=A0A834UVS4_MARMO|nr:hypothetical protein GHT09_016598 [Marmota monax]